MNMTLHFGKLRRTLAWGQKGWFLLVHEPEPMVCEVKWSYVAYVREEYLKLCSQVFVSSNHVSAFEWKAPFEQAGTTFKLKMD